MYNKNIFYTLSIIFVLSISYYFLFSAPRNFPVGITIKVEKGSSLRGVSLLLKDGNIIRSRLAFEALVIVFGGERVVESDYYFENKFSAPEVARRISRGEHHIAPTVVTIPEGFSNVEIAELSASKLKNFNKDNFLSAVSDKQGYLFPDTYFFLRTEGEEAVILSMTENFNNKIKNLQSDILKSGKTEKDVITMASVIEGEAKGDGDREIISGILWRRIKIGMPLQADAAPETYKAKGLPKSPINNPGRAAIMASIYPENTEYLYYLHDKKGVIHYAKTFAEHNRNIERYLK